MKRGWKRRVEEGICNLLKRGTHAEQGEEYAWHSPKEEELQRDEQHAKEHPRPEAVRNLRRLLSYLRDGGLEADVWAVVGECKDGIGGL